MADKIYCGSVKTRRTQYGDELKVALDITDFEKLFKEYGYIAKSGKRIINLNINERREVGQYGETHSITVDTWKPNNNTANTPAKKPAMPSDNAPVDIDFKRRDQPELDESVPTDFLDDIPF
jgi:hypothetical protein